MRILICGDRNWNDRGAILDTLFNIPNFGDINLVIDGAASGGDSIGHIIACQLGIPTQRFPADWTTYGRAAGPIRNQQMLDEGKPDLVLAFHKNIWSSKGTRDMLTRCKKHKVAYILYPPGQNF